MASITYDEMHARPHVAPAAAAFTELDLPAEVSRLQAETTWSTGQNARTLIKYDTLRVVLVALQAGKSLPEHRTEGRLTIHLVSGHLEVKAAERTFNLRPGGLLALDRNQSHEVLALRESVVLLTIAWPGRENDRADLV
jgi:quercetin dioxygenase-like cupin family protein